MTSNGAAAQQAFAPVLAALATLSSNEDRSRKTEAHEYLGNFQKSADAWTITHAILQDPGANVEAKLFAATTLKGKISYDISQIPRESLAGLRDSLLALLTTYRSGPRPVRTQLCVCLADLAIHMLEWKNVLESIVSSLGGDPENGNCILEFLRVLPEEVTEGRKITLTEDELSERTKELLEDQASHVLRILSNYSQSSASAASNPRLIECITAWLREVNIEDVVDSPLLDIVINALSSEASFDAAIECFCAIFRETREVNEYMQLIEKLYPRVIALRPKIEEASQSEDLDTYKGVTRLFAEAGEAWVLLVVRMPRHFKDLLEAILECCAKDRDREAISLTFNFWGEIRVYLTLERYIEARMQYADVFARLVDIMIKHLEFPNPEGEDESDLFEGDREQEEKFREFRHQMGDVLKDCCEVIGVTECLGKAFHLIQEWDGKYGSQVSEHKVPHWQEIEAPLFSMRAMGRMVDKDESVILPKVMPILVRAPNHEKVRFAAVMALGRYTEWTSEHPELLEPQLNFIIESFRSNSKEVVRAAALSLRYFCQDCRNLLKDHVRQLQEFYNSVLDGLPSSSQEEVTEGVANVVSVQPVDKIYEILKLFCEPLVNRLMSKADAARSVQGKAAEERKLAVADHLQLLTIFIQIVVPSVEQSQENPAVKYWQEVFPVFSTIADNFLDFSPICERICRCWRALIFSYRTATTPLLPGLANKLASCFAQSRQGCFLWTTDAILREFSEGSDSVDQATSDAIYQFFEQQAVSMLRALNELPPDDLPDVIEDFFRLLIDVLLYYPIKFITSELSNPIFRASLTALTLQKHEPLTATLHYLRDLLGYGTSNPPSSHLNLNPAAPPDQPVPNPPQVREEIQKLLLEQGEVLVQRVLTGMMFSFPRDCFPDASGVLLAVIELAPQQAVQWIAGTVQMLPAGTTNQPEIDRLVTSMNQKLQANEVRKVRYLLQDFTNSYRRRNVAPREGLGRLEAARFKFAG